MFKKTKESSQADLFSGFGQLLDDKKDRRLNDPQAWYNIFYKYFVTQIDEEKFSVLFSSTGRPNASIRTLVGMMSLKEGFGWSDSQLFEQVDFNVAVMKALGKTNLTDSTPSPATYYNFKKAIYNHAMATGENLIGSIFEQVTSAQADIFNVLGEYIRMDSTQIGSNIAKSTRLELVLGVIQQFYKHLKEKNKVAAEDREVLEGLTKKKPGQIVYVLDNLSRDQMLTDLGYILFRLVRDFSSEDNDKYELAAKVFSEQYQIVAENKVELKPHKSVPTDSVQSPHDEDAAFNNKNGRKNTGYTLNATETCDPEGLNLLTAVDLEKANTGDSRMFQPGIEKTKQVTGSKVKKVNVDGNYQTPDNREYAASEDMELLLGGLQGFESKYHFFYNDEKELTITDSETGISYKAVLAKNKKYRINKNGKTKYFTQNAVECYFLRKAIKEIPVEEKQRRNNVEATIFQLVVNIRNKKTRYRSLIKNRIWAFARGIWINLVRIAKNMEKMCPWSPNKGKTPSFFTVFHLLYSKNILIFIFAIIQTKNNNFIVKYEPLRVYQKPAF